MRYHEIVEKNIPNNPQLWGRAKAEASKRYKKHSAYKMAWASRWYKNKKGTWRTVSESIEDMITEISRPGYRDEAAEILRSKGYEELGSGTFANVFQRKSRPNEVIKLFGTNDDAYESYINFIMKHQDNPHFPKVIGKPILITHDYYAVKLEKLEPYEIKRDSVEFINNIDNYLHNFSSKSRNESFENYLDAFPKFKEALDLLKTHKDEVLFGWDIHSGNIMWRGNTIVLTDPLYNEDEMHYRSKISESMINEISRPEYRDEAADILRSKGYEELGSGVFANVFQRKSRPNEVIKLFGTSDVAYVDYLKFIMKHQDNPHFPKILGKPMKITPKYYAVKLEKLTKYDNKNNLHNVIETALRLATYLGPNDSPEDFKTHEPEYDKILDSKPKLKEAIFYLAQFKNTSKYKWDIHSGNVMWRGNDIVLTDPIYDEYAINDEFAIKKRNNVTEDLRDWFKSEWIDISRKVDGKHPPCGDSAGKGRRKKSNKAAYPKCVKKSKAKTMSKKDKESASRRKRDVERKSSGKTPNMVKTDT
jgi:hypothetical protein